MTRHVLQREEGQEAVAHLVLCAVAVEDGGVVVGGGEVTRGPEDVAGFDHYRLVIAGTERWLDVRIDRFLICLCLCLSVCLPVCLAV